MIGNLVGGCRLLEAVGQGGFGTVYKSVQMSLDRVVAVKLLQRKTPDGVDAVESLMNEARLAAKLSHPNVVRVYDCGSEGAVHYIVMEYVQGDTLDKVLSMQTPLPIIQALTIARAVASALDYAHKQGVVHADLNPRNVIIANDGRIVVNDFCGYREPDPESGRNIVGVPEYVSPEQAKGLKPTAKSDMYSLGIILYEMLTGKPPFSEQFAADTLFQQVSTEPKPPASMRPEIPRPLSVMLMRMLTKNPDLRHNNCGEIGKEIDSILMELQGSKAPKPPRERRPLPFAAVVLLFAMIAGIGGIGYLVRQSVSQERQLDALVSSPIPRAAPEAESALAQTVAEGYKEQMAKGREFTTQGDYHSAATSFHIAAKVKPAEVDPHLYLASIFIKRKDYERARQELDAVLRLDPSNKAAKEALAGISDEVE